MANKNDMSFLPEDYIEKRIEQRTNLLCLSLFVLVLAGVIGAYVVTSQHREEVRGEHAAISEEYQEAAKRIEQLEQLQAQKQRMMRKAQVTATLVEPVPRTFLLADLINRMPRTLSLLDMELASKVINKRKHKPGASALANRKKTDLTGEHRPDTDDLAVPEYLVSMSLVGVAPTDVVIAQYLASLQQSPLLSDVNLVYTEEAKIAEAAMRKFRIEMTLDATADVRGIDPLEIPRELERDPLDESGGVPSIEDLSVESISEVED